MHRNPAENDDRASDQPERYVRGVRLHQRPRRHSGDRHGHAKGHGAAAAETVGQGAAKLEQIQIILFLESVNLWEINCDSLPGFPA